LFISVAVSRHSPDLRRSGFKALEDCLQFFCALWPISFCCMTILRNGVVEVPRHLLGASSVTGRRAVAPKTLTPASAAADKQYVGSQCVNQGGSELYARCLEVFPQLVVVYLTWSVSVMVVSMAQAERTLAGVVIRLVLNKAGCRQQVCVFTVLNTCISF
ncbi:unnamed protein product, partial [Symbiodinium sp. KB8]